MKRKEADKICRKKKREFEKQKIAEIERAGEAKDMRNFYARVKEEKKGFQPKITFCKNKNGNLITDKEGILNRWADYFSELLNGDRMEQRNRERLTREENKKRVEEEERKVDQNNENKEEDGNKESTKPPTRQEIETAIK